MVDYGSRPNVYSDNNAPKLLTLVDQMRIKRVTIAPKYDPLINKAFSMKKSDFEVSAEDLVAMLESLTLLLTRVEQYPHYQFRDESRILLNHMYKLKTEEFSW